MANNEAGRISLGLDLDSRPIRHQANTLQSQLEHTFSGIGRKIGAALSVKALEDFSKQCLDLGSDLAEVQNVVDVTFTSMNGKVNEFAQNAADQFGLSETMAKRYAGTFGAMAKAFGFAEDQAADMSLALTGLAGDVASFYNIDQDAAYTKLKAVFSGETESLKELGIVMTQSALDQFALANGFGTTTARMSEQQKVALRYQFILSKLSDVSGDFARTSGGWANQVRILRLQFESLCAAIGQGLIAAFTPAIKALNSFMGALIKAANTFKSFVFSLFGQQSQDMTAGAAAAFSDLGAAAVGAGDSAADALGGMGDAAGGAAKDTKQAANEIQRALMGFDRINKLPDLSSDSGGSGSGGGGSGGKGGAGGGSGGLGDISSALKDTAYQVSGESVLGNALADMLKHCWDKADFTQIGTVFGTKLRDALDSIPWDGIRGVLNKIAKSTATLLNGFFEAQGLADSVGKTIGEALNTAFQFVNTFVEHFHWDSLGAFISSGIQSAFNAFDWGNLTKFVSGVIKGAFQFGTGLLEGIDWKELPGNLAKAVIEAVRGYDFAGVTKELRSLISAAINGALDFSAGVANLVITASISLTKKGWTSLKDLIGDKVEAVVTFVKKSGQTLAGLIGNTMNAVVSFAKRSGQSLKGLIGDSLSATVRFVKQKGQTLAKLIGSFFTATVRLRKGWTGSIARWITGSYKGIVSIGISLFKSGWSGIKSFFGLSSGGVIGANGGVKVFASGGSIVNGISKLWDFLPKYAGGTTDAHGSLFVAGENGPEIMGHIGGRTEILNQSQLAQTMHAAVTSGMVQAAHFMDRYTPRLVEIGRGIRQDTAQLTALATQAAQASGAGDTMEIIRLLRQILIALQSLDLDVELDGESLKRQIVHRINEHTLRTGRCEIMI